MENTTRAAMKITKKPTQDTMTYISEVILASVENRAALAPVGDWSLCNKKIIWGESWGKEHHANTFCEMPLTKAG